MGQFNISSQSSTKRFSIGEDSKNSTGGGRRYPSRLKPYDQWLVTHDTPDDGDRHKSPKYPSSGWNDGDLLSFKEASSRVERDENSGLAFRFTENDPFVGFDLDDVKQSDAFTEEALNIIRRLASYTEVSSSGSGAHVILQGCLDNDYKARADLSEAGQLEVYDRDRYFVLTGDVYEGYETVEDRPTVVREMQDEYLPSRQRFTFRDKQQSTHGDESIEGEDVTPEQVRRTIRAYSRSGKHDVDEEVLRLWDGSDEGRNSPSEADMALIKQLYYWCRGNRILMDRCFRASERLRPKWDEVHSSDGATYGEMTIQKVYRSNTERFNGRYVR